MWITPPVLDDIVDRALREDLSGGDVTTQATVPAERRAVATARAKSQLVVAGALVFARVFERVEPSVTFEALVPDGDTVAPGTNVWRVRGSAQALLMAERTALNLTQRMCGTATLARAFVDALPAGSKTRVTDTRKTTPGLRVLERYAVRCGGAHNHRDNLGTAVLIKDNHIVAAGGITQAVARARALAPHTTRVEVEVQSMEQLEEALAVRAEIIMLDNFSLEELRVAVARARGHAVLEASGGVTLDSVAAIASTGVDLVSVGALTHSAPAADLSLDLSLS